jgi:hypothetical protein
MTRHPLFISTLLLLLNHDVLLGILPVNAVNPRVIPGVLESVRERDIHLDLANSTRRDRWTRGMDAKDDSAATGIKLARQNTIGILNTTLDTASDLLGTPPLGGDAPSGQKFVVAQ